VIAAIGVLPASAANSEPASSAATSTTSTGLLTAVHADGVTVTGKAGLKKIWEW
jgi:hypothetical protein